MIPSSICLTVSSFPHPKPCFCHTFQRLILNAFLFFFNHHSLQKSSWLIKHISQERRRKLPFDDKLSPLTFGHHDQHVTAKHITPTVYLDVSSQTEIAFETGNFQTKRLWRAHHWVLKTIFFYPNLPKVLNQILSKKSN